MEKLLLISAKVFAVSILVDDLKISNKGEGRFLPRQRIGDADDDIADDQKPQYQACNPSNNRNPVQKISYDRNRYAADEQDQALIGMITCIKGFRAGNQRQEKKDIGKRRHDLVLLKIVDIVFAGGNRVVVPIVVFHINSPFISIKSVLFCTVPLTCLFQKTPYCSGVSISIIAHIRGRMQS